MKLNLKKAAAALAVAGALTLGGPAIVHADPNDGYTPPTPTPTSTPPGNSGNTPGPPAGTPGVPDFVTLPAQVPMTPGTARTVAFPTGTFAAGEPVTFALTGEGASAAGLATIVKTAVETKTTTKTAAADGSSAPTVTLHSTATGTYQLVGTGASGNTAAAVITVAGGAGGAVGADGSALPDTGTDSGLLLGLWVGGGALLLAGGAIVVATTVRRQRQGQHTA